MESNKPPRFIQIHTLHAYPAVLLNRDDTGLAKRLPFGGAIRTRISSQCLKRHWRKANGEWSLSSLNLPMAVRSREVIDREIYKFLLEKGIDGAIAEAVSLEFLNLFRKGTNSNKNDDNDSDEKTDKKAKRNKKETSFSTSQVILFGRPEIDFLSKKALEIAQGLKTPKDAADEVKKFLNENKSNIKAMQLHGGLESALFGRMVTSDLLANVDAAIHVAHSFTVHKEESENDYFTAVDDLKQASEGDDNGAAGIFDTELTSGLYYGYVVIDVPALISNLLGIKAEDWDKLDVDRTIAGNVVKHLLHLIAKESPGAKRGGTAPYGWAELTFIEMGDRQPRSLANAFRDPVRMKMEGGLFSNSVAQLQAHLKSLDACYGIKEARCFASPHLVQLEAAECLTFDTLGEWAAQAIVNGHG